MHSVYAYATYVMDVTYDVISVLMCEMYCSEESKTYYDRKLFLPLNNYNMNDVLSSHSVENVEVKSPAT
jgi:hypothetical protein